MDAIKDWEAQREEESSFRDPALRTWAKQILQGMSAYILPMIYGLVGSCAFVLRTMSRQIRDLTFSSEGAIQYMLRLVLGALAGISIGWFLSPNSNNLDIASSISPLALAFVAGYSVELVFMAMDRVITAFTEKSASQSGTQSPAGTVT